MERILRAIPPEDGEIVAVESFRRALVDLLSRPDSPRSRWNRSSPSPPSSQPHWARRALEKALEVAVEDEAIEKKIGCDALETFAGNVFADAITCVTLDLVAAVGDERDAAGRRPGSCDRWRRCVSDPPPGRLAGSPQLRAAIADEASLKASPGDDAAMRRLPFVKKERGRPGAGGDAHETDRADTRGSNRTLGRDGYCGRHPRRWTPGAPFLCGRCDGAETRGDRRSGGS